MNEPRTRMRRSTTRRAMRLARSASMGLLLSLAGVLTSGGCVGDDPVTGAAVCQPGAKQCLDAVPQVCDANGRWHDTPACGGLTPICTAGACVAFRVRGGLGTLGVPPAPAHLRVKDNGFEVSPRMCGSSLCVRGGFVP